MKKSKAKSKSKSKSKTKTKARPRVINPTIGLLIAATPDVWNPYITAFKSAVSTIGVSYDPQPPPPGGAGGDAVDYDALAKQLVKDKVDVIVTAGNLAAVACKKATKTIPIVIASAGDLTGLAGGNLTGCTNGQANPQILDARITRMLQKLAPKKAVAVAGNDSVAPVQTAMNNALASLRKKKVPVYLASFTQASDFQDEATIQARLNPPAGTPIADVLLVCSDPLMRSYGTIFVKAAHGMHMKTMHEFAEWHNKHRGDRCFGPDFTQLFQRAAGYVDQILNGAFAANLPVFESQVSDCVETP
jgi:putative tryptophan/tyrosine transport system substrate-binding protein